MIPESSVQFALFVANAVVFILNVAAFATSDEPRDLMAAVAWMGSAAYWLWRATM
jgi:hypothetical protein